MAQTDEDSPSTDADTSVDDESASAGASEDDETGGDGYSRDTIHHILRNRRRRAVLFYLKYHDSPVEMRELTEEIASWECGVPVDQLTSAQRERVYVSLHQTHLPTLAEHDIIEYDKDRQKIYRSEGAEAFEPFVDPKQADDEMEELIYEYGPRTVYAGLERGDLPETRKTKLLKLLTPRIDPEMNWSNYYLTVAALSTIFVALASPLSPAQIPMALVAFVNVGMLATIAFIHKFAEADPEQIATAEEMFLGRLRPDWARSRRNKD